MITSRTEHVLKARIFHKDQDGNPTEDFDGMCWRVANFLGETEEESKTFFKLINNLHFLPNSPCLVNAGVKDRLNMLSACFVLDVEDSIDDIFGTIRQAALIHKVGGGTGFNFSKIRPKNSRVKSTAGVASGPVSFMRAFDAATEAIKQGGTRRGANMGVLRVDHPDIMEFIHCKQDNISLQNINISVAITDEFMEAVFRDKDFTLKCPASGNTTQVSAKKVWEALVSSAHATGDPGVLFIDTIGKHNPLEGEDNSIGATNPCWTGDTKVWTVYGPRTFASLALLGHDIPVLSQNMATGFLEFKMMRKPRLTRKGVNTVKITFDNGTSLTCTPDHNIYLKSGIKVEAQHLKPGDSIESVYRYNVNQKGYKRISNGKHTPLEHNLVAEWKFGKSVNYPKENVHHMDEQKDNNHPDNLIIISSSDHISERMQGINNPMYGIWDERNSLFGKDVSGENNPRYRDDLDEDAMRDMRSTGMSYKAIAEKLGCSKYTGMKRLGYERPSNHKVVSVEHISTPTDVYNGTVDDNHNYFVFCGDDDAILSANCGEQPLAPNEACGLGSINLSAMVIDGVIDFQLLKRVTQDAVLFLNRMLDKSDYPNQQIHDRVKASRKIGLGIMGLADMFIKLKIPYTSSNALDVIDGVMETILDTSVLATHTLGHENGVFPLFASYAMPKHIKESLKRLGIPSENYTPWNSALLTIAPTGTLSIIAETSSGIEPIFHFEQEERRVDTVTIHKHPIYKKFIEDYPRVSLPNYFQELKDVDIESHVEIQATCQKYICSSVSKTINMPSSATIFEVEQAYKEAYLSGCKGITIYRDGSKDNQVISSLKKDPIYISPEPRPKRLSGDTVSIKTGYGDMLVTLNYNNGRLFEVACLLGKSGGSEMAKAEAIGRLSSLILRSGIHPKFLVEQLENIVGAEGVWTEYGFIKSIPDALAKILINEVLAEVKPSPTKVMSKCPDCGNTNMEREGSCSKCVDCGWKSCG